MSQTVTLTREELYTLVWAEPLSTLAKRYSLSDYAFRQLCIRLSIPIPRQGHWSKVREGERPDSPPFPPNYKGDATVQLSAPGKPGTRTATSLPATTTRPKSIPEDPLITAARTQLKGNDKRWLDNGLT